LPYNPTVRLAGSQRWRVWLELLVPRLDLAWLV